MAKTVVQINAVSFLYLLLAGCGGSSSDDSSNVTGEQNNVPSCSSNQLVVLRGSSSVSVGRSLQCAESDGDTLTFEPSVIESDNIATGEYSAGISISDGCGGQTSVQLQYQITNQCPQCIAKRVGQVSPQVVKA
ncbi:hypothetical protein JL49_19480 [Pseudoalteromonas luteoviolacea]|nr:hypothetical protein JL49_19480 [Pseudoalteromonas luteoviolacea]